MSLAPEDAIATAVRLAEEKTRIWLEQTKTCSRCPFEGKNKEFPLIVVRGSVRSRSFCHECLQVYYAQVEAFRKTTRKKARHQAEAAAPISPAPTTSQRIDMIRQRHEEMLARKGAAS